MNQQRLIKIGKRTVLNKVTDTVRLVQQHFPFDMLRYVDYASFSQHGNYSRKLELAMKGYLAQRKELQKCELFDELNEFDNKISQITIKLPSMKISCNNNSK